MAALNRRKRFKWTRERYRAASSLGRFMVRQMNPQEFPDEPPTLVRRLHELWDRHPQRPDPLTVRTVDRLADFRDIPF